MVTGHCFANGSILRQCKTSSLYVQFYFVALFVKLKSSVFQMIRSESRVGQEWVKSGSEVGQKWVRSGSGVGQECVSNESGWFGSNSNMFQKWIKPAGHVWLKNGLNFCQM